MTLSDLSNDVILGLDPGIFTKKPVLRLSGAGVFYKLFKIIGIKLESSILKPKHFFPKSFNDAPIW